VCSAPDARLSIVFAGDQPHPTIALLHRDLLPFIEKEISASSYKLRPALETAAQQIALQYAIQSDRVFIRYDAPVEIELMNLNTPEDLSRAETFTTASKEFSSSPRRSQRCRHTNPHEIP
jgi:molybdopterin-guanine dinucleotide biosynthesis protein A